MRVLVFNLPEIIDPPMFVVRYVGSTCRGAAIFTGTEITNNKELREIPWLFSTHELALMLESGEAEFVNTKDEEAA